jgi:hypothetical protein
MRALALVCPIAAIMGGIQAALIVSLRISKSRHIDWPMTLMAVLSAIFLAAGVLCHYWDIWKHRTVRGISFIFVFIDALGDVFSLVSVFFQPRLDVLGMIIYGTEFVLWCGIFACGGYYNFRPWLKERMEQRRSRSVTSGSGPERPTQSGVALHTLPSSTSVFRTPSGEAASLRARTSTHAPSAERVALS